jgi:hypothetical protein
MNQIGTQLTYVKKVLEAHTHPIDAGLTAEDVEKRAELASQLVKVVMQVVVSLVVLVGAMYLLLRGSEPTQKIASGLIGTVLGYWLR